MILKKEKIYSKKIRVVYILAASHSGSTLLSMLLSAHPEICTVGELKATSLDDTENYLCSCREKIKKCPFWRDISNIMSKRGFAFDITNAGTDFSSVKSKYVRSLLAPLHRGPLLEKIRDLFLNLSPTWQQQLPRIQAINTNLIESILIRTGKKIIVDSSKIGIRLKYLMQNPSLDVLVIRLIRDGRGVALAYMDPANFADASNPHFRQGGTGGNRESERLSMAEAAMEWRRSNEEAEAIISRLDKSRWIEVRYEDLCINKDATLHKLFTFIGVDPGKAVLDFRSVEHHIIGNGMRLDFIGEVRLDERWRSRLNEGDLKVFESVSGKLNRSLGYH